MGLSITDAATLVAKGYKVGELKTVGTMIDNNPEEGSNIIELAKKLKFSDFEQAMALFGKPDQGTSEDKKKEEPDNDTHDDQGENSNDDQGENSNDDSSGEDQGNEDDVDYKKLYEEEKSLRQKLQQNNQSTDTSGKEDEKSDWDIAMQVASDVLN